MVKYDAPERKELIEALTEFVDVIDISGGCTVDHDGLSVPVAAEDWADLGVAYLKACEALKRKPKWEGD